MKVNKTVKLYEDFQNEQGQWLISKCITISTNNYESHHSLSGARWGGILKRCIVDGDQQTRYPRYKGTENHFTDFQEFVEWSRGEVGYLLREPIGDRSWAYSVEKDILGQGKKIYSPETCLLVPNAVNMFLTARNASRGEWPLGVAWKKSNSKFEGQVKDRGKKTYLGLFTDPFECHRAWQKAKVDNGRRFALEFKDWHGKLYNGLNAWLDKIQDDYDNHRETIL